MRKLEPSTPTLDPTVCLLAECASRMTAEEWRDVIAKTSERLAALWEGL